MSTSGEAWRDTLFVWKGKIHSDDKDATEPAITWTGTWVGCEHCPDARTAPTPNDIAFEESPVHFQVSGTGKQIEENKNGIASATDFWKFELTGGSGSDLGKDQDKQRHKDRSHNVLMKYLPWKYRESVGDTLVVAVGENEFGSFVSAGFVEDKGLRRRNIVLGRRYLGDKDPRAAWSVQDLYERVAKTDTLCQDLVMHNVWNKNTNKGVRVPPWRTIYLQAETFQLPSSSAQKRQRTEDDIIDLNIPENEGFSSKLVIHEEETDYETDEPHHDLTSDVRYVEQCSGCGKSIFHDNTSYQKRSCIEVMEYTPEEPNRGIGCARYCSPKCARENGAPAWAEAGKKWAQDMWGTGYFLKSFGESCFWQYVWEDKKARKVMKKAGWKKSGFDFHICAEGEQESNWHDY